MYYKYYNIVGNEVSVIRLEGGNFYVFFILGFDWSLNIAFFFSFVYTHSL